MVRTVVAGAVLAVLGMLAAGPAVHRLGHARAAAKWHPEHGNRLARAVLTLIGLLGVTLLAAGTGLLIHPVPALVRLDPARVPPLVVSLVTAAISWIIGMYVAAKLADRVELSTLIRGPGTAAGTARPATGRDGPRAAGDVRDSDPDVPPTAEPGMVYRDAGGAWYLVVSAGTGFRLVALPDFTLTPPGTVRPPVVRVGSVELSVWPLNGNPQTTGATGGIGAATSHPAGRP